MATKRTLIHRIYKISRELLNGIFNDTAWENLNKVFENLNSNGYEVTITDTKYDDLKSKTYYFEINNLEHVIRGHITCSFCGSVENPMSHYDMSMILY